VSNIHKVKGIAIAVPLGYLGNVEDLVVPIPKLSTVQKEVLKSKGKPVPKQLDVQLLIQWKEPDNDDKYISWENKTTCRTLWKKNGDPVLLSAAKHFEGHYRKAGGKHLSEERSVSPFEILPIGSSLSPEGTPDPETLASTTTTRENTPVTPIDPKDETKDNAAAKAAARVEFKSDWCEEMSIDPKRMTDAERGSFLASFKVYWDQLNTA
jgi:hypothetical protein